MNVSDYLYFFNTRYGSFVSRLQCRRNASAIVSVDTFNHCLKALVNSNEKFLLGRLGATESCLLRAYYTRMGLGSRRLAFQCQRNAGLAPASELSDIAQLYLDALPDFHFLAEWACPGQSILKKHLNNNNKLAFLYPLEALNPLSLNLVYKIPARDLWLHSLVGKKILVVHPFSQSFHESKTRDLGQYEEQLLPRLNYTCVEPPVTFGAYGEIFSFARNLEQLCHNVYQISQKQSFDVALIAAGGYGLPLSAFIYKQGIASKVFHIGGALQLYFGVIGTRWLTRPYSDMYLDYPGLKDWSRVVDKSCLKLAAVVEGGCYV